MNFSVKRISNDDWKAMSQDAHLVSFGEIRPPTLDRSDYALVVLDLQGAIAGYVTCIEMDSETVYWQHGGAMPEYKDTIYSIQGYTRFVAWCCERYQRVNTRIENTNTVMLKMAMKLGFRITGVHNFKNKIFVELNLEFGGK